ncbi:hypothetical protein ACF8EF_20710 [Pseudomonas sp. zjy_15]|uniref:hypothetical protein n=1 Tax=unclassified Pseudomonas TaxID=196821 RepID=UPI000FA3C6DE|nr:hypothetical protein [Pseudomonas sp. GD03862]MDH0707032.1 hypothetical protein [Pseudomonas sp. GD03862]
MKVPLSENAKLMLADPKAVREFMTAIIAQDDAPLDKPIEIPPITVRASEKQNFKIKLEKVD